MPPPGACVTEYERWLLGGDIDAAVGLLRRLAAQVVRTRSFPPPAGYRRWDDDAVLELLAEMIDEKRGVGFLLETLTAADDQGSAERYLLTAVENFLRDQAKLTAHGKLRARLETLLGQDSRFTAVPVPVRGWRLASGPEGWWQGDITDLHRPALQVRGVFIPSWNRAGPTPRPARHALTTVAAAVLTAAGGTVRAEDLARVLLERFRFAIAPETVDAQVVDDLDGRSAPADLEPEQALVGIAADDLWASLTGEQQAIVPYLSSSAGAVAALGIGLKQARARIAQVVEIVRLATVDDSRADAVVTGLLDLATVTTAPASELARPSTGESPDTNGRMGR